MQEIWVGTKAQAPSDLKPILRRLYKNEIRAADPTVLDAWYLKKKELNKEKKLNKTKRKERCWFWGLDDNHVLYPFLYTPTFLPMMPRPGTQALVVSRAVKIAISALFASSLIRNIIIHHCHIPQPKLLPYSWPAESFQDRGDMIVFLCLG